MKYYPLLLNLNNKNCLVVGAGDVAFRKIKLLLKCKANITVVAKKTNSDIRKLSRQKKIKLYERSFKKKDLWNAFLVICATNDKKINYKISSLAKEKNILINVVDSPELCNFIVPSTFTRGDLSISISTQGSSPGLSKKIRTELEKIFSKSYKDIINELGRLRKHIIKNIKKNKEKNKIWKEIFNFPLINNPDLFLKRIKNKYKNITGDKNLKNGGQS